MYILQLYAELITKRKVFVTRLGLELFIFLSFAYIILNALIYSKTSYANDVVVRVFEDDRFDISLGYFAILACCAVVFVAHMIVTEWDISILAFIALNFLFLTVILTLGCFIIFINDAILAKKFSYDEISQLICFIFTSSATMLFFIRQAFKLFENIKWYHIAQASVLPLVIASLLLNTAWLTDHLLIYATTIAIFPSCIRMHVDGDYLNFVELLNNKKLLTLAIILCIISWVILVVVGFTPTFAMKSATQGATKFLTVKQAVFAVTTGLAATKINDLMNAHVSEVETAKKVAETVQAIAGDGGYLKGHIYTKTGKVEINVAIPEEAISSDGTLNQTVNLHQATSNARDFKNNPIPSIDVLPRAYPAPHSGPTQTAYDPWTNGRIWRGVGSNQPPSGWSAVPPNYPKSMIGGRGTDK